MGLKSGSGGDPYEDDEDGQEATDDDGAVDEPTSTEQSTEPQPETTMQKPTLPYIHARDKVNENRDQVPFFLRDFVRDGEDELINAVEGTLDESVPKSDVREAAMLVAQENPELVADKLREWGYDYE